MTNIIFRSSRVLVGIICFILIGTTSALAVTVVVSPGQSIGDALDGLLPGDIVMVECGTYYEQNLQLPDGVHLLGEMTASDLDCVTIMTDGSAPALVCENLTSATRIENLTIKGHPLVSEPEVSRGGGIYLWQSSPLITHCRFENLTATYGGAAYCDSSSTPVFQDCVFRGNRARAVGGAMVSIRAAQPTLIQCLVVGNDALGGGAAFNSANASHITMNHCTVAGNGLAADPVDPTDDIAALSFWNAADDTLLNSIVTGTKVWVGDQSSIIKADCSDIYATSGPTPIYPEFGVNISADPLFCENLAGDHHYNLNEASPCTPEASPACGGMGAMPVGCALSPVDDSLPDDTNLPAVTRLRDAFPNPFNPRTTIRFDLHRPGHATIAVFDVAGRLVTRLVDENLTAGAHEVTWHGRNQQDRPAAAGVYFVRLKTTGSTDTRRLTLLK